jgi:hypothetical protein
MMVRNSPTRSAFAGLLVTALLAGCSSDKTGPDSNAPAVIESVAALPLAGTAGQPLNDSVRVRVSDSRGNAASGITVAWGVTSGGGTTSPSNSSTGPDGVARTRWTLGTGAGANTLTATVQGLSPLTLTATGQPGSPATGAVSGGDDQTATVGAVLADSLAVLVRDAHGNGVAGVPVSWTVAQDAGSVQPAASNTDQGGVARASWTLGTTAGELTATATPHGTAPVAFTATALPGPVTQIEVDPPAAELFLGGTLQLEASARDQHGNSHANATIVWSSSDASKASVSTTGLVTAHQEGTVTITAAHGTLSASAEVEVVGATPLVVTTSTLDVARLARPHDVQLEADGGIPPYAWQVVSGQLPAGLSLSSAGRITGTATSLGVSTFRVSVGDSRGSQQSANLSLQVCEAALDLNVGESVVWPFPHGCGVLLAERTGAVYRVGVMARNYGTNGAVSGNVAGGILVDRRASSSAGGPLLAPMAGAAEARPRHEDLAFDAETRRLMAATEALHVRLREEEMRRFGRGSPAPLGPHDPQLALAGASSTPDTARTFWIHNPAGGSRIEINARLRAVGEHIIYYEQAGMTGSDVATGAEVQAVIDYYDTHGKPIIDSVFGGLGPPGTTSTFAGAARLAADIDGNGKVVLLQISATNMISEAAAYVTSCDRYPRFENYGSGPYYCTGSNEAEIMYMLRPNSAFYLGTAVHEAKHISSHGYAVFAGRGFQPSWIEEGTAEIAKELSSRRASGHDFSERVALAQIYLGGSVNANTYGMAVVHARARAFLGAAPLNSVIGNPNPNPNNSTFYGSSWLFHRYLADQHANGDVTGFFRALNVTGTGPARLEAVTGRTLAQLLSDFMVALVLEGEPDAWAASTVRFTSYDYAGISSPFVIWTWPNFLHTGGFATGSTQLSTVYGSTNFFQLSSPGGIVQRLDLMRLDSEPLSASHDVALTIVRVR